MTAPLSTVRAIVMRPRRGTESFDESMPRAVFLHPLAGDLEDLARTLRRRVRLRGVAGIVLEATPDVARSFGWTRPGPIPELHRTAYLRLVATLPDASRSRVMAEMRREGHRKGEHTHTPPTCATCLRPISEHPPGCFQPGCAP